MANCVRFLAIVTAVLLSALPIGCVRPGRGPKPVEPGAEAALPREMRCATDGSVLLLVPGGGCVVGAPGQEKAVTVRSFYMDRTEVTNAQYAKFLAEVQKQGDAAWRHPSQPAAKKSHVPGVWGNPNLGEAKADHPVVGVDWFDAHAYAKWADKRLPTEAEWEKAARGTDGRAYPWGSAPPEQRFRYLANFFGSHLGADGFRFTAPVGSFPAGASPCGCLDMAGNAAEWCADWFGPLPAEAKLDNPLGPATGTERVTKGGAWNLNADSLRTCCRWPLEPGRQLANVGFRCAKDAPLPPPAPAK